jgi:hypothetical protein
MFSAMARSDNPRFARRADTPEEQAEVERWLAAGEIVGAENPADARRGVWRRRGRLGRDITPLAGGAPKSHQTEVRKRWRPKGNSVAAGISRTTIAARCAAVDHPLQVGEPETFPIVLAHHAHRARCDLVAADSILLGEKRLHVAHKPLRDLEWQFKRLALQRRVGLCVIIGGPDAAKK